MITQKNKSGSALFIVLGCVALMTLLVVAFLGSSIAERSTSNFFAKEVNAKLLSENAVNMVLAQLRTGTKSTSPTGKTVAWASQPGMIRTYDNGGLADSYYKLYSSSNMVGTGAYDATAATKDAIDANWQTETELYTDLNEAVNQRNPIVSAYDANGNALKSMTIAGHANVLSYKSTSTGTAPDIEGFYVDGAPTSTNNQVPMPLKWIYILSDGTQVLPTARAAGGVDVPGAGAANPIVGRIAFWTDDETGKVNINTASEGSTWDVPTTWASEDMGAYDTVTTSATYGNAVYPFGMATSVAAGGEYQRIPGHPATTSLSTVFGSVLPIPSGTLLESDYNTFIAPYYTLTPRYAPGGSKAGTRPSYNDNSNGSSTPGDANYDTQGFLKPYSYRLYTSVDELMFDPQRIPIGTANSNVDSDASGVGISPTGGRTAIAMNQNFFAETQFFLTANNKAPEETLFDTPRICLWPIQTDAAHARNVKDNLLAFCSTIHGFPYYFQRTSCYQYVSASNVTTSGVVPTGPTGVPAGSSQDMAIDLGGTTTVAGVVIPGGPDGTATYTGTTTKRNQNLLAYLRALTSADGTPRNIPGFGGNFLTKYPVASGAAASDIDQILVDMIDYIRSNVNTYSLGISPKYTFSTMGVGGSTGAVGAGSALPLQVAIPATGSGTGGTIAGLGRNPTVAEVSLVFMPAGFLDQTKLGTTPTVLTVPTGGTCTTYYPTAGADGLPDDVLGYQASTTSSTATPSGTLVYDGIGDPQTTQMQAFILIRPFNPLPSIASVNPNLRFSVNGLNNWTINWGGGTSPVGSGSVNLGFNSGNTSASLPTTTQISNNTSQTVNLENTTGFPSRAPLMWGILPWIAAITDYNYSTHRSPGTSNGDLTAANYAIYPLAGSVLTLPNSANPSNYGGLTGTIPGTKILYRTLTGTAPGKVTANTFSFNGGNIAITVSSGYPTAGATAPVIQTINMYFPPIDSLPVPSYVCPDTNENGYGSGLDGGLNNASPYKGPGNNFTNYNNNEFYTQVHFNVGSKYTDYDSPSTTYNKGNYGDLAERLGNQTYTGTSSTTGSATFGWNQYQVIQRGDTVRSLVLNPNSKIQGDIRLVANMPVVPLKAPGDSSQYIYNYLGTNQTKDSRGYLIYSTNAYNNQDFHQLHSLSWDDGNGVAYESRAVALPYSPAPTDMSTPSLIGSAPPNWYSYSAPQHGAGTQGTYGGVLVAGAKYDAEAQPQVTPELNGAYMDSGHTIAGDWTSGIGAVPDGAMVTTPDEGYQSAIGVAGWNTYNNVYYMTQGGIVAGGNSVYSAESFSPNRQIASAVMFGTLPACVQSGQPWRTLLFCPNPAAGSLHPGFGVGSGTAGPTDVAPFTSPPDHLLLDLFWMPIIDPYAISEPFATSGKVNMNYQIEPFTYIHRSTAVRAVLKSVGLQAIPLGASQGLNGNANTPQYKSTTLHSGFYSSSYYSHNDHYRYNVNLDATVDASDSPFQTRFGSNEIFRSASEICNIFLVPQAISGYTYTSAGANTPPTSLPGAYTATAAWWTNFQLTGDNERESPYNKIYPRLTTKSNTFQVHFRVQTLVKNHRSGTSESVFDTSNGDAVGGEYRGSSIIERYIDPNDATIPDFAADNTSPVTKSFASAGTTLDSYYRYRVVRSKSFNP